MDVLVTCKYEEDPIKNEGARVDTTLYINFSDAQGQITLVLVSVSGRNLNSSKLSCMSSLPARMRMIESKMKELKCSQDFSHYKSMGIFPDAQGQLTPQSLVRSGRISNSFEMLWMFLLPASMKKIRSKMKALEWTQHFPHYNPMGAICCHGNQSSNPMGGGLGSLLYGDVSVMLTLAVSMTLFQLIREKKLKNYNLINESTSRQLYP